MDYGGEEDDFDEEDLDDEEAEEFLGLKKEMDDEQSWLFLNQFVVHSEFKEITIYFPQFKKKCVQNRKLGFSPKTYKNILEKNSFNIQHFQYFVFILLSFKSNLLISLRESNISPGSLAFPSVYPRLLWTSLSAHKGIFSTVFHLPSPSQFIQNFPLWKKIVGNPIFLRLSLFLVYTLLFHFQWVPDTGTLLTNLAQKYCPKI